MRISGPFFFAGRKRSAAFLSRARMSIAVEAEHGMRNPRAGQVGLDLVEEGIHPRSFEEILDVLGVAVELLEGGGGDGGFAGFAGLALSSVPIAWRCDRLRGRGRGRDL